MTNYNERLDEALFDLVNQVAANEQRLLNGNATREETIDSDSNATMRAKQAIASLIKELVAEAKPKIDLLDIGVLTGRTIAVDRLGRENRHAPKDEQKFAGSNTIEPHQAAYMVAYKLSSDEFEQNLLKALEEV